MARKTEKEKSLTWDKTAYVITCGADEKNGQRRPRVWRLGADERWGKVQAEHIRFCWSGCVEAGRNAGKKKSQIVWTEDHLKLVAGYLATKRMLLEVASEQVSDFQKLASDSRQKPIVISRPTSSDADESEGDYSLSAAIDDYARKLDADVPSSERGTPDAERQKTSLNVLKRFIADQPYDPAADKQLPTKPADQTKHFAELFSNPSPICDRSINAISYDQISAFIINLKNRRVSGYAPLTIRNTAQHVENFLGWLESAGKWRATCNYSKLLKVKTSKLYTPLELKKMSKGQDTYTPDELATIWANGNDQQRLYLMLGLNLCAAQQTLADLLHEDIHLEADQPHVEFIRGKTRHSANGGTGIEVRYDLWPLTAKLLAARVKTTQKNEAGLALLTAEGFPLVRHDSGPKKKSKSDSVAQTFNKLLKAANSEEHPVRPLGFKFIRKTVATAVLRLADEYTQQQALTQARKTIAGRHYTGAADFQKMNDALRSFWSELEPKFKAAEAKVEAEERTKKAARRAAYLERQKKRYQSKKAEVVAA